MRREDDYNSGPSRGGVIWAAALMAIAILVGIVVMSALDGGDSGSDGASSLPSSEVTPTESTLPADNGVTTTTQPPRLSSTVKVIVTNGSGVNKAARRVNDALTPSGFQMVTPRDANGSNKADAVFFKQVTDATTGTVTSSFQAEAQAIATQLGVSIVSPLPEEVTIKTPPAIPDFDVQVMVGPVLAAKYPAPGAAAPAAPPAAPAA